METWDADRGSGPCGEISASARDLIAFARMHLDRGLGPDGVRLLHHLERFGIVFRELREVDGPAQIVG